MKVLMLSSLIIVLLLFQILHAALKSRPDDTHRYKYSTIKKGNSKTISLCCFYIFLHKIVINILYLFYNNYVIFPHSGNRGEVKMMFLSFLYSVTASIVSYYICKWLDEYFKDN